VSHARAKIADYPFTTLHPQLGVVRLDDDTEFVVADLPGLIEGASEGAGLGTRFLGHVERCAVILHLIDGTEENVVDAYRTIRHELADYGHGLAEKPEIVGLNKIDAIDPEAVAEKCRALTRVARPGTQILALSGVSGAGLPRCSVPSPGQSKPPGKPPPICRWSRHDEVPSRCRAKIPLRPSGGEGGDPPRSGGEG